MSSRASLLLLLLVGCAKPDDAHALPACDAPAVQEAARQAASSAVKVPFAFSTFSEVASESTDSKRACRVRATHAASGAAIWMRFTVAQQPVKKPVQGEPPEELAIVFAPLE
ncbi:MAG TPA: hypothetical protein VFX59_17975 [Polyangiales bacterium]|nr:hypothetical protein [Polyangiales bacterium]